MVEITRVQIPTTIAFQYTGAYIDATPYKPAIYHLYVGWYTAEPLSMQLSNSSTKINKENFLSPLISGYPIRYLFSHFDNIDKYYIWASFSANTPITTLVIAKYPFL